MDAVDVQVKSVVVNTVARAYGFVRTDDGVACCPGCGGDGCEECAGTGLKDGRG